MGKFSNKTAMTQNTANKGKEAKMATVSSTGCKGPQRGARFMAEEAPRTILILVGSKYRNSNSWTTTTSS